MIASPDRDLTGLPFDDDVLCHAVDRFRLRPRQLHWCWREVVWPGASLRQPESVERQPCRRVKTDTEGTHILPAY